MFDRLGPGRGFGGDSAAQAEPQHLYLGQAGPSYQAAAFWCFNIIMVDKHGRPVRDCIMQRQGTCERPHDRKSCLLLYDSNTERGVKFRQQLKAYVQLVIDNRMREPSKEQLQEAGVLPNWNAQKKLKSKDRCEIDSLPQKQNEVNRQQSTRRSLLALWRQSQSAKCLQRSKSRRHRMVNRVLHWLQLTANRID